MIGRIESTKDAEDVAGVESIIDHNDVYSLVSSAQKRTILLVGGGIALLTPFTDTVYLPALAAIQKDLNASPDLVNLTVSAYMAAVGIGQLVWGPLLDRFGRTAILYLALILFILFTFGCAFSPNITSLVVFRIAEGFVVGSTIVAVKCCVADAFPPAERGGATGAVLSPMLIGPVIAPLIGGALCDSFDWRSTFYLLIAMGGITLIITVAFVPETHPYFITQNSPDLTGKFNFSKPTLKSPLGTLYFFCDKELIPFFISMATTFGSMFTSLTVLPNVLANKPYDMSAGNIGYCFLPAGVAMLVATILGGMQSDAAAFKWSADPAGRLVYASRAIFLCSICCASFGIALQYEAHLAALLITQSSVCFAQAYFMPGCLGYLSEARQEFAGAVNACAMFTGFFAAAVSIQVSTALDPIIGYAGYFFILSGLNALSGGYSFYAIFSRLENAEPNNS